MNRSIDKLLRERNYYKILNVAENATDEEIRLAYRGLMKTYHPDIIKHHPDYEQIGEEKATRMAQLINDAYDMLKNPVTRKEFDEELAAIRRQREQAKAANEARRQREEARTQSETSYSRSQNAYHGTYGYERPGSTGSRTNTQSDSQRRTGQTSGAHYQGNYSRQRAYGASRKYKRAKSNPYVKAVFTKFKSKFAEIFSEENLNDCKLIARGIARYIKEIYKKEKRGVVLGTINGLLIATMLFNIIGANERKMEEEPIIPEETITVEMEQDTTSPNLGYEVPIIIEDETYELVEYYTPSYGESLSVIGERYGVTVEELKRANDLDSDLIRTDREYKVVKTVSEDELDDYSVNYAYKGETISDLARMFDTDVQTIRNLNQDIIVGDNIVSGVDTVRVPDLARQHQRQR